MYTALTLFFQRGLVQVKLQPDPQDGSYWLSLALDGTDLLLKLSQATLVQLAQQVMGVVWPDLRLRVTNGDGMGALAPSEALQQER